MLSTDELFSLMLAEPDVQKLNQFELHIFHEEKAAAESELKRRIRKMESGEKGGEKLSRGGGGGSKATKDHGGSKGKSRERVQSSVDNMRRTRDASVVKSGGGSDSQRFGSGDTSQRGDDDDDVDDPLHFNTGRYVDPAMDGSSLTADQLAGTRPGELGGGVQANIKAKRGLERKKSLSNASRTAADLATLNEEGQGAD